MRLTWLLHVCVSSQHRPMCHRYVQSI